ncbi:hypothetical protein THTE_3881 [Thermogutta terrifontis]|uniref:Uncharacterized protein n=1 Tax=Thermogutta terrifontis TaxID=1331910 RepID=A0A286RKL5_9BACT|nr:hypothetical protein THTE_3881 [Thermogutta terrifontis]
MLVRRPRPDLIGSVESHSGLRVRLANLRLTVTRLVLAVWAGEIAGFIR